MQEQLREEQKKASSSYLFSYTTTSRLIVLASRKLEDQLSPADGQAEHKEHIHLGGGGVLWEKSVNPAIQTCTKNNLQISALK